jgi:hypothetical protein
VANYEKIFQVYKTLHACGTQQRLVHLLQEMFRLVSVLLLTHVNMTPNARAHMSQCRWGNGGSHGTDVALECSKASRLGMVLVTPQDKFHCCEVWRAILAANTTSCTGRTRIITWLLILTIKPAAWTTREAASVAVLMWGPSFSITG